MKQMQDIRNEIVPLIREVCMALTGHANDNEVALLVGTAAAESSLTHRVQIGGGPARGLWQMEVATGKDIFQNYLHFRPERANKVLEILITGVPGTSLGLLLTEGVGYGLEHHDGFACAMARIHYLRDPHPIPDTLEGQAEYWLKVYNRGGKGTVEHYLTQWYACGCYRLMEG